MLGNLITIALGVVAVLISMGKIQVSKDSGKNQEYLTKYGQMIRICGIVLIGIGVLYALFR